MINLRCLKGCRKFQNISTRFRVNCRVIHGRSLSGNSRVSDENYGENCDFSNVTNLVRSLAKSRTVNLNKVLQKISIDDFSDDHAIFLLECCAGSIPGENFEGKHKICVEILKKFNEKGIFSEKVYMTFIQVSTENRQVLNTDSIIDRLGDKCSHRILKLLFRNVCELGDSAQAFKILEIFKKRGIAVDEEVFNNLILCSTINGGLNGGLSVRNTMQLAKIEESSDTKYAIIRGLAQRKSLKEFLEYFSVSPIELNEEKTLELTRIFGFSNNSSYLKYIEDRLPGSYTKNFLNNIEKLVSNLISNNFPDSGMTIYKFFIVPKPDEIKYAGEILEQMLFCNVSVEKLVGFSNNLREEKLNEFVLEDLIHVAFRHKMFEVAMDLLRNLNSELRPHYFWPILIDSHSKFGENGANLTRILTQNLTEMCRIVGILNVMENLRNFDVKFDKFTFRDVIFPRFNLENPARIIRMFQEFDYTVRSLISPLLFVLLNRNEMESVSNLCGKYPEIELDSEDLMEILPNVWISTADNRVCLNLVQKMSEEKNEGYLNNFLVKILHSCENPNMLGNFLNLLNESRARKLRIDTSTSEILINLIKNKFGNSKLSSKIEDSIDDLCDFSKISSNKSQIPHPKDMNVDQLECHLIELKSKNMETRGAIRKLIQLHTNDRNFQRVEQLKSELDSKRYAESPGIISNRMYVEIRLKNVENALQLFGELNKFANFKIDSYKIIDLAQLLVEENQFEKSLEILKDSVEIRNMKSLKSIERNCTVLLNSIDNPEDQIEMFKVLSENHYCTGSNLILGCLIQKQLEKGNLEETVELFTKFAEKFKKTPMKQTLVNRTIELNQSELLQKVLEATALVYGTVAAQASLISGLCETGCERQLIALLQDTQLNCVREMEKMCERWAFLNKIEPLKLLLKISREVSPKLLNKTKIQSCLMEIFSKNNDCDSALEFYKNSLENEEFVSGEIENEIFNLFDRCKIELPQGLQVKYKIK